MEEAMSQDDCSSWKSQRPAMMTANDYVLVPNLYAFLVSLLVPFTFHILQQDVKNTKANVLNLCIHSFLRYFIYSQSKHSSLHLLPNTLSLQSSIVDRGHFSHTKLEIILGTLKCTIIIRTLIFILVFLAPSHDDPHVLTKLKSM